MSTAETQTAWYRIEPGELELDSLTTVVAAGRRATYGGSPGDGHHPEPYLYASPWAGRIDSFFDDPGFKGAALPYADLLTAADPAKTALQFLREARDRVRRHG